MESIDHDPAARAELAHVPIDLIDPPSTNCRSVAGDVEDLARSIRVHGLLTPLRLCPVAGGRYEVVAGERRWRAAQLAGLVEVPAAIDTSLGEAERLSAQIAENVDRLELSQLERVHAIQQLLELGISDEEAGLRTGAEPEQIALLRRMATLPDQARRLIDEGALSLEYAAELAQLEDAQVLDQALADITDGHHPRAAIDRAPEKVRRRRIESEARAKLERQRIRIVDPPSGYDFAASSITRQIGSGSRALHVDVRQHRKEPCHAACLNLWARSAKDAVVHVCTDVRRHAADPDAGVDPHLRLSPDEARQQRTEKRAQKKAWRQSHASRRKAGMRMLSNFDDGKGIARLVEEIVGDQVRTDDAVLALAFLGVDGIDELQARDELHRLARTGDPCSRLRVAVALLMGRAEAAFAKERGDWKECENVRAHFRHLVAHGYELGAGEVAQLASLFSIDSLDAPGPRAGWCSFSPDATDDVDGRGAEGDPEALAEPGEGVEQAGGMDRDELQEG